MRTREKNKVGFQYNECKATFFYEKVENIKIYIIIYIIKFKFPTHKTKAP